MPVPLSRASAVLQTIQGAVQTALNGAGLTGVAAAGQVVVGDPPGTELAKLLGAGLPIVTVNDRGNVVNTTRTPPFIRDVTNPATTLVATVAQNVVTFSGMPGQVCNVHTFVGVPYTDAYVQTTANDTLATIATKVAAAVNALAIAGVTATASGTSVTVSGSPFMRCNVSATGLYAAKVVGTRTRSIQVSVRAADDLTRGLLAEPIIESIGTGDPEWFALPDGLPLYVELQTEAMLDQLVQGQWNEYAHHIVFRVEYHVYRLLPAAIVGAAVATTVIDDGAATTSYSGGT